MSNFSDLVESLDTKDKKLLQQKQSLENELESLKSQKQLLQSRTEELGQTVEQLEEKNKILRIAGGSTSEDKREMKLKINEIVREVDKCIAQLNQ